MFLLNPFGKILNDDFPYQNFENGLTITFTTWPFSGRYCRQKIKVYELLINQSMQYNTCFRDVITSKTSTTTLSRTLKKTSSDYLLDVLVRDKSFRDVILRQTIKTTKLQTYLGTF